jgi:hypothetical protein
MPVLKNVAIRWAVSELIEIANTLVHNIAIHDKITAIDRASMTCV